MLKTKDATNIYGTLDEYKSIGTHWIDLYVNGNNAKYFDSFGVEKFIYNKNIIANIYRIQAYDSMMCGYFCIIFIDFMFKDKCLWGCTNLLFSN